MNLRIFFTVVIVFVVSPPTWAQLPWQFQWKKGQILNYKINHVTTVVEVIDMKQTSSTSTLELVNRWNVTDVDAKGIASLSMTLVSMRTEQKRPNGDTLLFDSQNTEKSTPEMRDQMSKHIGQVHAQLRVDAYGRVIDVKQGSAANFEVEPPFLVVFPDAKSAVGQAWRRPFKVVLDPPFGTGEKYEADQRYECKAIEGDKATVAVTTHFKAAPDNARERLPLLQKDVQGELIIDLRAGRLMSAQLNIDKTVENHQGKGSTYQFKSRYVRELVE